MALADKHLLRLDKSDLRTARFEMLDVIRGYAREQLNSLEHSNRYERAFAVYYVDILRRDARSREDAAGASRWIELVATEYMNICAALRWSVDNDRSIGLQLALALPEFWERKGLYAEARRWLEALLDPIDATIEREYRIVAWRAVNALALSYYWTAEAKRACSLHKRALAMTRSYDDPSMTAKSLNNLGIALLETGEAEQARSVLQGSSNCDQGRSRRRLVRRIYGRELGNRAAHVQRVQAGFEMPRARTRTLPLDRRCVG